MGLVCCETHVLSLAIVAAPHGEGGVHLAAHRPLQGVTHFLPHVILQGKDGFLCEVMEARLGIHHLG